MAVTLPCTKVKNVLYTYFPENWGLYTGASVILYSGRYNICVKNYKYGEDAKLWDYVWDFLGSDIPCQW